MARCATDEDARCCDFLRVAVGSMHARIQAQVLAGDCGPVWLSPVVGTCVHVTRRSLWALPADRSMREARGVRTGQLYVCGPKVVG